MAKNSIGQFIAALRKANGMTQQEVADRLNVSNKAVSRWERDECAPDLSVIPALAEMFGVTCDELLRGARNNSGKEVICEISVNKQKAKSDKQFRVMLYNRLKKYKNLTLISVGITILGLIAAMMANLAFSKGLIAFCLATAFIVASEICQVCIAVNARLLIDEDDDSYTDKIQETNTSITKTAVSISFINISLFAFCLPLVTIIDGANFGLHFDSWLTYGILFSFVTVAIAYVVYTLFVSKYLHQHKLIALSNEQIASSERNRKLLLKTLAISVSIGLLIGIGILVLNSVGRVGLTKKVVFENCADFKAFMEREYDEWYEEGYSHIDSDGNKVIHAPIKPDYDVIYPDGKEQPEDDYYPNKVYKEIRNASGDVICEYYYNPDLYKEIIFTESSNDKMPVTVITSQAHYDAVNWFQDIESALYFLIVLNFIVASGFCLLKIKLKKKDK